MILAILLNLIQTTAPDPFVRLDPGTVLLLLIQTGGLFYWGGGIRQILKDHERRIGEGEDWRKDIDGERRHTIRREDDQ